MEKCYAGAIAMPSSYVVMNEEEMTYTEGGGSIPRAAAAFALDIGFAALPIGAVLAPLKFLGKTFARNLIKKNIGKIFPLVEKAIVFLGGCAGSFALNGSTSYLMGLIDDSLSCCTSLGGIISLIMDCQDKDGQSKTIVW